MEYQTAQDGGRRNVERMNGRAGQGHEKQHGRRHGHGKRFGAAQGEGLGTSSPTTT